MRMAVAGRANHGNYVKGCFANLQTRLAAQKVSMDLSPRQKGLKSANGCIGLTLVTYPSDMKLKNRRSVQEPHQADCRPRYHCRQHWHHDWDGRRASAFTITESGLDYQTMSNWYLRSYPLTSLTLSLIRFTILAIISNQIDEVLAAVKPRDITRAIETADMALATTNWRKIEPILMTGMPDSHYPNHPLCRVTCRPSITSSSAD